MNRDIYKQNSEAGYNGNLLTQFLLFRNMILLGTLMIITNVQYFNFSEFLYIVNKLCVK